MNRIKTLLKIFAFALLILGVPNLASAQWRNDDYYGNRRNDSYGNRRVLTDAARRVESNSRSFRRTLDRELDRSRYDNSRREDRINDVAERFATAADNLEDSIDDGRNRNSRRLQEVFSLASQIDRFMSRNSFSYNVENQWNQIRRDLQTIANASGYNYNGGSYRDRDRRDDDYRRRDDNRRPPYGSGRRTGRFPF
jgi:hypothetical protein